MSMEWKHMFLCRVGRLSRGSQMGQRKWMSMEFGV